jgi:hypothetical protein
VFYEIHSVRLLLARLDYNLLFRWFVGLSLDDPIRHPTTFTKNRVSDVNQVDGRSTRFSSDNRERLLNEQVMGCYPKKLIGAPEVKPLLSDEHFSVDGTLLQAWESHASLERIDGKEDPPPPPSGPGEGFGAPKPGRKQAKGDFRGVKLSSTTHRLLRQRSRCVDGLQVQRPPNTAQLSGHVHMDNRHALIVDCQVTQATGIGERDAAKAGG